MSIKREPVSEQANRRFQAFWKPGDVIHCVAVNTQRGYATCELCETKPVAWRHVLENQRTGEHLAVGADCLILAVEAAREFDARLQIVYPFDLARQANRIIADRRSDAARVESPA